MWLLELVAPLQILGAANGTSDATVFFRALLGIMTMQLELVRYLYGIEELPRHYRGDVAGIGATHKLLSQGRQGLVGARATWMVLVWY